VRQGRATRRQFLFWLAAATTTGLLASGDKTSSPAGSTRHQSTSLPTYQLPTHLPRTELAPTHPGREHRHRSLLHLAHLTDAHITDEESPLRADGLMAALGEPVTPNAHKPHEPYSLHLLDAAVCALNAARSPVTGRPADLCLFTGDATDNAQRNEFAWFLQIMNGGEVDPNSGGPTFDGYPGEEELAALLAANRPFAAPGLAVPWYALSGNHDILALGAFPITERLNAMVTGNQRINGPPLFQPSRVPADPDRAFVPTADLPNLFGEHMPALHYAVDFPNRDLPPAGGACPERSRRRNTRGAIRLICIDTCNRGGGPANTGGGHGSLDPAQFAWLEEQIAAAPGLVIVAGHHPLSDPNWGLCRPDADKSTGRVILADQVIALLDRYPQVVAYLCGHGHRHQITPHASPLPAGGIEGGHGFWEIQTSSVFDPPHQSRLIELFDNDDGTLSLLCTVIDPAFPLLAGGTEGGPGLADHARAVARADPQYRHLSGTPQDRDVELLLPAPSSLTNLVKGW
jgi:3',5'-cyclic AMP phosphodiesterase CpdA